MADETTTTADIAAASPWSSGKTAKELEHTVLLGRGKSHLNHQGNKYFQDLIVATVDAYAKEPSVFVKRQMTLKIVEQIEEKGGFLRWTNKNGGGWETIDLEERRQKVAHALQYRIRCMNNTNGGKRARAAAMKATKSGTDVPVTHKKSKIASIPFVELPVLPQGKSAMVAFTAPAPPDTNVATVVVGCEATTKEPEATKAAELPPNAPIKTEPIQLTEDERSFVRSFVNNPAAGPTDSDEEDSWQDNSSPAAVAATAAQLAAVTAVADTVLLPTLPVLPPEEAPSTDVVRPAAQTSSTDKAPPDMANASKVRDNNEVANGETTHVEDFPV